MNRPRGIFELAQLHFELALTKQRHINILCTHSLCFDILFLLRPPWICTVFVSVPTSDFSIQNNMCNIVLCYFVSMSGSIHKINVSV